MPKKRKLEESSLAPTYAMMLNKFAEEIDKKVREDFKKDRESTLSYFPGSPISEIEGGSHNTVCIPRAISITPYEPSDDFPSSEHSDSMGESKAGEAGPNMPHPSPWVY